MRPVFGPKGEDWSKYDTPYKSPGVHLDVDPPTYFEEENFDLAHQILNSLSYTEDKVFLKENNVRNIKMGRNALGVLNLFDNAEEDGGFHFVPGGHKMIKQWYDDNKSFLGKAVGSGKHNFASKDYNFMYTERIPCPAGTLIVFDINVPHGTKPNTNTNNRMVQFLRYMPKSLLTKESYQKRRKYLIRRCGEIGFELNKDDLNIL